MSESEKSEAAVVTEEIVHASDESKDAVSETKYDDEFQKYEDSPKNIVMLSERAFINIYISIFVLMLEVWWTPTLPVSCAVLFQLFPLFSYLLLASLAAGESALPTEPMSESEKSEAAAVTEEIVHASDESKDAVSETKYDEFHEFHDQQYFENRFVQRFVFKMTYGHRLKRFVAPIVNESFVFDMSTLKEKITYLFNLNLPINSELELSYIDEHGELITMTDDEDLEDIMRQMTLPFLRMHVKVINNAPPVQVGTGAGLNKHTSSSESTSTSESDSLAKPFIDDWLVY